MKYLIMEESGHRIVDGKDVAEIIDNGKGEIKIYRLCGMNPPKELFLRWFGNVWTLTDMYGNVEPGV